MPRASDKPPATSDRSAGDLRFLLITTEPRVGEAVKAEIERRAGGRGVQTMAVIPALAESRFRHVVGAVDEAVAAASEQREQVGSEVEEAGSELFTEPRIGDADPLLAIEDALREFPADEILIVTRRGEQAAWLEEDLFERARTKFEPPISHFVVDAQAGDGRILEREWAAAGVDQPEEAEVEADSGNLPSYSPRDLFGIAYAIVGTLVLVVLAADCSFSHGGKGGLGPCAGRLLIAGAIGLANLAHVVGLMLFQTARDRGPWPRLFAHLSIYGTTLGIIAALLIDD